MSEFASETALMVFGEDLRIVGWNDGAEQLTGIPAADALGRRCWEVIAGHDDRGDLTCHAFCSRARLIREGRCVPPAFLHTRTADGRRRLKYETITVRRQAGSLFVHAIHDAPVQDACPPAPEVAAPELAPRQREILGLLAEGNAVKTIARMLSLSESTVRNHVRQVLLALGAHSQLEAVARARAFGLVP